MSTTRRPEASPDAEPNYPVIVRPSEPTTAGTVPRRPRRSLVVPLLAGVAGLAVLAGAAHVALNWRSEQALERLEGDVEARERLADARVRGEALRQAELAEAAALSVARSKLNRELARLDAARAAVAELRDARRRLDGARSALLDGEPGRAVADDESLLTRAEAALAATAELPGTPPDAAVERLDGLADPLRAAGANLPADYAPTPALGREIDAVAREARGRAEALAAAAGLWEDLAARAGAAPPGGPTLRAALDRLRRDRDARAAEARAEETEAARRENEDRVAAAERAADRLEADAKVAAAERLGAERAEAIRAAAEKREADLAAANAAAAARAAQEALERDFARDRAAVSRHLSVVHRRREQVPGPKRPGRERPRVSRGDPRGGGARRFRGRAGKYVEGPPQQLQRPERGRLGGRPLLEIPLGLAGRAPGLHFGNAATAAEVWRPDGRERAARAVDARRRKNPPDVLADPAGRSGFLMF